MRARYVSANSEHAGSQVDYIVNSILYVHVYYVSELMCNLSWFRPLCYYDNLLY